MAILYSQPSIFWEENYRTNTWDIYSHLNFLVAKITFVSEKMLREELRASIKTYILVWRTGLAALPTLMLAIGFLRKQYLQPPDALLDGWHVTWAARGLTSRQATTGHRYLCGGKTVPNQAEVGPSGG